MTVTLGNRYQDKVSGWEGIATARYEYLNGCVRYEIAFHDKDGKPEAFVFDEDQLIEVAAEGVAHQPKPTGGPQDNKPVLR